MDPYSPTVKENGTPRYFKEAVSASVPQSISQRGKQVNSLGSRVLVGF